MLRQQVGGSCVSWRRPRPWMVRGVEGPLVGTRWA